MTILEAIEEANNAAEIPTLAFANLREFNAFMDSFRYDQYPVNVVVPFDDNGQWTGPLRKSTIPLQGWVIMEIPQDPLDVRTVEAHRKYVEPMKRKAIAFIRELLSTDIIDPEVAIPTDTIRPEYAFLTNYLFGVSYTINLPVVKGVC